MSGCSHESLLKLTNWRPIRIIVRRLISARVAEALGKWVTIDFETGNLLILVCGDGDKLRLAKDERGKSGLVQVNALIGDECWWV